MTLEIIKPAVPKLREVRCIREGERVKVLEGGKLRADFNAQQAHLFANAIDAKLRIGEGMLRDKQLMPGMKGFRVRCQHPDTADVLFVLPSEMARSVMRAVRRQATAAEKYTFELAQKTQETRIKVQRLFPATSGRLRPDGTFESFSLPILDSRAHLERIG